MARMIAVINQKGGVAKSTTAAALLAGLTLKGYKVLAIDLDAQTSLSFIAGAETEGVITSWHVFHRKGKAADAIQRTEAGDIIASNKELAGADAEITGTGREYRLKEALAPIAGNYDYIIIDTPPALGIITVNALTACDSVIIPAQADVLSIQAITQLAETVGDVRIYTNPALTIEGILLTRYGSRAVLSREFADMAGEIAAQLGTKVFRSRIREGVAVKEAQATRQSLFSYAPTAKVTEDYKAFVEELLEGANNGK